MFNFDFSPAGDDARTTEGWVKHDLESGRTDSDWLSCSAIDAMYTDDPAGYLTELLSHVEVSDAVRLRALAGTVVELQRELQDNWDALSYCADCAESYAPKLSEVHPSICPRCARGNKRGT